jgi:Ser/Thr protein kinase RdoA (MazF antagonist)
VDADRIVECFSLGALRELPVAVASGWGGRNHVWRFRTTRGVLAVKETIAELLPDDPAEAFRVEALAVEGGVAAAEPVPSSAGKSYELVGDRWYRSHRLVDGVAKRNEDTTIDEAHQMGALVAGLHLLAIPSTPRPSSIGFGREHWSALARRSVGAPWADLAAAHLDAIDAAESLAASVDDVEAIGSHGDLNAHNVLFAADRLVLIDWDAAGPASARYERVSTAALWAQRGHGRFDVDVATSFLRGYRDQGGHVEIADVDAMPRWLAGLTWWTERNLQIAAARPSREHDELAVGLVGALVNGVASVELRQRLVSDAIARL